MTGTWSPLANLAPSPTGTGTMMMLSNGTVMVEGGGTTNSWYQLTPSTSGSYTQGTWTSLASMSLQRLYFASNVLPSGNVFCVGGEYSGPTGAQNFTNTGEIYNPVTNSWQATENFPQQQFGDDPSELLPDGRVLAGYIGGPQTYIYSPATNSWSFAANKLLNDQSDEETWVKLPDNSILTYDVFNPSHAQRYIPATNQWIDAGNVPVALSGAAYGSEIGPAFLLPDGWVFYLGANGNTAYYSPASNSWTAGPVVPNGLGCGDAPGAMMPNGDILFAANPPNTVQKYFGPTTIFEFNPTTNTYVNETPTIVNLSGSAYLSRMLVLPTGQVLFSDDSNQLAVYTPSGDTNQAWAPTISSITNNGNGTYTLTGTQLNGISEGAAYGDDAEMSTNYPLVRLVDASGNVEYARTFNWSSTGVATGNAVESTQFTLPAGFNPANATISVVANGLASTSWSVKTVATPDSKAPQSGGDALIVDPATGDIYVKSVQDPSGSPVQLARVTPQGTVKILHTFNGLKNSDGSGIALDPLNKDEIIVADEEPGALTSRIALINIKTNAVSTLLQLPWKMNPGSEGTGQEQFATDPSNPDILYFWDTTEHSLYQYNQKTKQLTPPLVTLPGSTILEDGNCVVFDPASGNLLLTDGVGEDVLEVNPRTTPATVTTLFSTQQLQGRPGAIALNPQTGEVFIDVVNNGGDSILVGSRLGGPLSLVVAGLGATGLAVGNATNGMGLSLFVVSRSSKTLHEISQVNTPF